MSHYTTESLCFDEDGDEICPKKCAITRFGSSAQVAETLVKRIRLVEKSKDDMTPAQWEDYRKSKVKCYEEETSFKLARNVAKEALRAERAKLKRDAKVAALFKAPKTK
jgi:hypothetical protein